MCILLQLDFAKNACQSTRAIFFRLYKLLTAMTEHVTDKATMAVLSALFSLPQLNSRDVTGTKPPAYGDANTKHSDGSADIKCIKCVSHVLSAIITYEMLMHCVSLYL